jgi:WD40 repeat protein
VIEPPFAQDSLRLRLTTSRRLLPTTESWQLTEDFEPWAPLALHLAVWLVSKDSEPSKFSQVTGSLDMTVKIWNPSTLECIGTLDCLGDSVMQVISPRSILQTKQLRRPKNPKLFASNHPGHFRGQQMAPSGWHTLYPHLGFCRASAVPRAGRISMANVFRRWNAICGRKRRFAEHPGKSYTKYNGLYTANPETLNLGACVPEPVACDTKP